MRAGGGVHFWWNITECHVLFLTHRCLCAKGRIPAPCLVRFCYVCRDIAHGLPSSIVSLTACLGIYCFTYSFPTELYLLQRAAKLFPNITGCIIVVKSTNSILPPWIRKEVISFYKESCMFHGLDGGLAPEMESHSDPKGVCRICLWFKSGYHWQLEGYEN